jgi:hypothetical protein
MDQGVVVDIGVGSADVAQDVDEFPCPPCLRIVLFRAPSRISIDLYRFFDIHIPSLSASLAALAALSFVRNLSDCCVKQRNSAA